MDANPVITVRQPGRCVSTGTMVLEPGRDYPVAVRYAHATGPASLHVSWSGPAFAARLLEPSSHPSGL